MNRIARFQFNFCYSFSRISRYSLTALLGVVLLSDTVGGLENYSSKRSPEIVLDKYRENFPYIEVGDKQILLRSYQNQQKVYLAQQATPTPSIPLNPEQRKLYEQGVNLFQQGENLRKKGNREGYNQAIKKYQQALKITQDIGLRQEEAEINQRIGVVYFLLFDNKNALEFHKKALSILQELNQPLLQASALSFIGEVYVGMGEHEKAIEYFNQAESSFRAQKQFGFLAITLNSTSNAYIRLGQMKNALNSLNQAVEIYRTTFKDPDKEAYIVDMIAFIYSQIGESDTALQYYNQALDIQRKRRDLLAQAKIMSHIGSLYGKLGKHQQALEVLNKALKIKQSKGTLVDQGLTIQDIAGVHNSLGNYQQAIEHYKKAKSLFHQAGWTTLESQSIGLIVSIYRNFLGDNQEALKYTDEALQLQRQAGDKEDEAYTLNQQADIYLLQGDYQLALDSYNQALTIERSITKNPRAEARTLANIALLYNSLGDNNSSVKTYTQALDIYRKLDNQGEQARIIRAIGNVYQLDGRHNEALESYNQALSLHRKQKDNQSEIATLWGIAKTHRSLKDYKKAFDAANQALVLSQQYQYSFEQTASLGIIGSIYFAKSDYQNALNSYKNILVDDRKAGLRIKEAETLNTMSMAYEFQKQYQQAIDILNQELKLRRNLKDSTGEAQALYQIAINQRNLGNLEAALSNIQTTIKIVENIRGNVQSDELRTSYFATVQNYYKLYIDLLMQLHKQDPTKVCEFNIQDLKIKDRCDAVALHISERARTRSLVELLKAGNVNLRKDVDPQLLVEERRLQNKLKFQETRLSDLLSQKGSSTELINKTNQEITNIIQESQTVTAKIRATNPERAELTNPKDILQLPEIQQQLDKDTILLQYSLGEKRSYLWVVTPNSSLESYELPGQKEIAKAANKFNSFVKQPLIQNPNPAEIAEAITNTEKAADALSQIILNDVAGKLGNKRLVIIADGILHQVSFAALNEPRKSPTSNKYQPLVVNHEIVNLPSISSIATHRKKLKTRDVALKTLAVLANPVFSADDTRLKNDKPSSVENNLDHSALETLRNTNQVLEPLPGTQAEGEAILELVNSPSNKLSAFGLDANYNFATSKQLRQYRYLLFATHGIFNTVNPALSGIVLSLVDKQGKPQTRSFLRLNDIFNLDLPAELIVLSACESGRGEDVQGEGLVGLTRGFMYAGAARVTVSLWNVNDKSTKELMIAFYKQILEQKKSPAAALNFAQRQMWQRKDLQNPAWKHPRYWAAFTLQGEWR